MTSNEQFESLIKMIKYRDRLTESEICKELGYSPGYLSQVRSRGDIPEKLILRLKEKYHVKENDMEINTMNEEAKYSTFSRIDDLIRIIEKQQETIHFLTTGKTQETKNFGKVN